MKVLPTLATTVAAAFALTVVTPPPAYSADHVANLAVSSSRATDPFHGFAIPDRMRAENPQLANDIQIALELTRVDGMSILFDEINAAERGMSRTFLSTYAVSARSAPSGLADPQQRELIDPRVNCLMNQLGWSIAFATLAISVFASGGFAALALAGFVVASWQFIAACYQI